MMCNARGMFGGKIEVRAYLKCPRAPGPEKKSLSAGVSDTVLCYEGNPCTITVK